MRKTYVMSDVHGYLDRFKRMLKEIKFTKTDKLYIVGDAIDRGPDSIELIKYIMRKKNIILIKGNHESMMLESLNLGRNVRKDKGEDQGQLVEAVEVYKDWLNQGGDRTLCNFRKQTKSMQKSIRDYLTRLEDYKVLNVKGKMYLLIHAGLLIPRDNIELKSLINANIQANELHLYIRDEFWDSEYYLEDGMVMVVGHTSTRSLKRLVKDIDKDNLEKVEKDMIYIDKDKICLDCGAGNKLACLRLDDMKEFYVFD